MERRSQHKGALSGRRRRRRTQQQRGASNGCKVVGAILASLYTFCSVVDTLQLHIWSISRSSPRLPMASSPFLSPHTPPRFLFLQLCAPRGRCMNGCSSSGRTRMEIIRSHPTQNSSSAAQSIWKHMERNVTEPICSFSFLPLRGENEKVLPP